MQHHPVLAVSEIASFFRTKSVLSSLNTTSSLLTIAFVAISCSLISEASAAPELRVYALGQSVDEKTGASGPLMAEQDFSGDVGVTEARSSADYGVLRVFSEAHAANQGGFNLLQAGAQASWEDIAMIDSPGLTGTSGSLTVKFKINGSLASSGGGNANRRSRANADFVFTANNNNVLSGLEILYYDGGTGGTPFLGIEQTATFNFVYGTPFNLKLHVGTSARAYLYLGADSIGDLANTATWGGFVSVKDSGDNLVTNYTASSVSGANYVLPIVPPVPRLTFQTIGTDLKLRWNTNFTGFVIESSENLSNMWNVVTNGVTSTGGSESVITIPTDETQRYFRLRK